MSTSWIYDGLALRFRGWLESARGDVCASDSPQMTSFPDGTRMAQRRRE
jgi:hypothetical protein